MKKHKSAWPSLYPRSIQLGLIFLLSCLMTAFGAQAAPSTPLPLANPGLKPRIAEGYGKLPMSFEPNQGQTAPEVKFLARGPGYGLFLTPTEAVLTLHKPKDAEAPLLQRDLAGVNRRLASAVQAQSVLDNPPVALHMKLIGANPHPAITGIDKLPGKVNYLRGNNPKQWRTGILTYGKVKYAQVYPGIDLVYYGNPQQLEHDFVVAPRANPSSIAMEISGAGKASVDSRGDLVLVSQAGEIRLKKPVMYQEVNGLHRDVASGYVLKAGQRVGFQVGAYDATRPLVIDPVLVYSTFLSGGSDYGLGIAVDTAGQAYVTGFTESPNFPTTAGAFQTQPLVQGGVDAFVAQLKADGSGLVYSTYLGGSDADYGYGIAVDMAGHAYVTGFTRSTDFPTTAGAFQTTLRSLENAFVAQLKTDGSGLIYSTYLGGSGPGADYGYGIAVDTAGDTAGQAYVVGTTGSTDFPTTAGAFQTFFQGGFDDAFVAKLKADGSGLVYSTYLGGGDDDHGYAIAVDTAGHAYVTGGTSNYPITGGAFPTTPGAFQTTLQGAFNAFVTQLKADGSGLVYSTYLGGYYDFGYGIAVDTAGQAYVTGVTESTNFPTTAGAFQTTRQGSSDAFVAQLKADGSGLVYSTYLGGGDSNGGFGDSAGLGIAVDTATAGQAYVTGVTESTNFPTTAGAFQTTFHGIKGNVDVFVAQLKADGSGLVYSTYLGGGGSDFGYGIAVDMAGQAYVTGETGATDFPTTAGAFQTTFQGLQGGADVFVTKFGSSVVPPSILSFTATPTLGTAPVAGVPVAFAVTVADPSKVQSVQWDFNGDGTVDQTTTTLTTQFTYTTVGSFPAKATVIDTDGGEASATTTVTVQSPAQAIAAANTLVQQLPLSSGLKTSLTAKPNAVAGYLTQGDVADACSTLVAEVNAVNALVRSGQLSAASAAPLLGEVQAIQRSLGCL